MRPRDALPISGTMYIAPLILDQGVGKHHYNVWNKCCPGVEHYKVQVTDKAPVTTHTNIAFLTAEGLDQFMEWWETYSWRFDDQWSPYPSPRASCRYSVVEVSARDDMMARWVWIVQNCSSHVAIMSGGTNEYGELLKVYVLFEDDLEKTKFQLRW